jgi:hypothetical protein
MRGLGVIAVAMLWIGAALNADAGASLDAQRVIGALTWLLLGTLLVGEEPAVRMQVVVAVLFATVIEYTSSVVLQLYIYRLHNVPAFVPPGHGLVYLAALTAGRTHAFDRWTPQLRWVVLLLCGGWMLWGALASSRSDTLSIMLFLLFVWFVLAGRAPAVYIAAFLITTFLELLGTAVGDWKWSAADPLGVFGLGNPPAAIVGCYCVIDAIGLRARTWRIRLARVGLAAKTAPSALQSGD